MFDLDYIGHSVILWMLSFCSHKSGLALQNAIIDVIITEADGKIKVKGMLSNLRLLLTRIGS